MPGYLERYRAKRRAFKFNMSLHVNFEKAVDSCIKTISPAVLVTEQLEVYSDTDIKECSRLLQNRIEPYEDT